MPSCRASVHFNSSLFRVTFHNALSYYLQNCHSYLKLNLNFPPYYLFKVVGNCASGKVTLCSLKEFAGFVNTTSVEMYY